MRSCLAEKLKLKYSPVAILFSDEKPEGALQFLTGKRGCVIALLNAAAKGRAAAVDKDTIGCLGGASGMCFGNRYDAFPGGIEYFLSTGRGEGFREGEGYKKTPALAKSFIDSLPYETFDKRYVVFKPFDQVDAAKERPELVCLYANADQLSALCVLANYDDGGTDAVTIPFGAGCQTVCMFPYVQRKQQRPKAVVGLTDITVRPIVPADILSFTVLFSEFEKMEINAKGSFLDKALWQKIAARI